MRPRRKAGARLTAQELVDVVARSGMSFQTHPVELRVFLADLGYDPLQYIRARVAVRTGSNPRGDL